MRILFLYTNLSSFVKADIKILESKYSLIRYHHKPIKRPFSFFYQHLKLLIFLIRNISNIDVIYTWFGDYHAFTAGLIAKVFNKKHIIVIGGYDAVSIPEISYGVFYKNNIRSKMVLSAYRWADVILSVDKSLIEGNNSYSEGNNIVGIGNFDNSLIPKSIVLPTGYNSDEWKCGNSKRINQVLTVGLANKKSYTIKGFDLFVECAKNMPDYDFVYVGLEKENIPIEFESVSNLKVFGKIPQADLKEYYCKSKVYVQFSLTEGLPNTLCEAMLSECVVLGSRVGGIPTVIRKKEYVLDEKNIDKAVGMIENAMLEDKSVGVENREFIKNNYRISKRAKILYSIIDRFDEEFS